MYFQSSLSRRLQMLVATAALLLLAACSTLDQGPAPALQRGASWVVLPFANNTETPLAGNRAQSIAQAILQAQGVGNVSRAPLAAKDRDTLFDGDDSAKVADALGWAREHHARYALTGSVEEWRYKVGIDGEPAAGVTLRIIDVESGNTLWSGSGAESGWSRQALAAVGQKLIRKLLLAGLSDTH